MLTTHLPAPSIGSLAAEGVSINHSAISSVLALLGWEDKHPVMTQATEAEHALADNLQTAYTHYLTLSDQSSVENLNASLTAVIKKLEKDRATATRLATEASDRMIQEKTDYLNSGMNAFIGGLTTRFKTLLRSDDAALVEHYTHLAAKYTAQLEELFHLRTTLQWPLVETAVIAETTEHPSKQRRLLQTTDQLTPNQIYKPVCYRFGAYRSALSKDYSGFTLEGEIAGDTFGYSVSAAGDINGDGLSDILVGANGVGKSYVVFGSRNSTAWGSEILNISSLADGQRGFVLQGEGGNFGYSVSTAGDTNGDGLGDILIGAPWAGKSYIVFGSRNSMAWESGTLNISSLMDGQRGFVLQGEGGSFGSSVSTAGDINGDGLSDILVGAPYALSFVGKSYVVFGCRNSSVWEAGKLNISSLMDGQRGFMLRGEAEEDKSGASLSTAGDINGDGLADILVQAQSPLGNKNYVVLGSRNSSAWGSGKLNIGSLMDGQRGFVLQGESSTSLSAASVTVSTAGDINGDGLSDILMAADLAERSYVVFGSSNSRAWGSGVVDINNLLDGQRGFALQKGEVDNDFGYSVSAAGDINGDGLADILVGAPADQFSENIGKSYVVLGSRNSTAWASGRLNISSLMDRQRGFVLQGEAPGDASGSSVSTAGDINGDGLADILVGAPGSLEASSRIGKSYVVFGSPLYFIANSLRIGVGESVQLNRQNLVVGSTRSDIDSNILAVTVENVENGYFMMRSALSSIVNLTHFYMQNISEGTIYFVHTGGIHEPNYTVVINAVGVLPLSICSGVQITYFNLMNNQFVVTQNLTKLNMPLTHRQVCVTNEDCSNTVLNDRLGFVLQGEEAGDNFGYSVSAAGDINGDGLADILVGASDASSQSGKSYLVFGSRNSAAWGPGILINISSLMDGQRGFVLEGEMKDDQSGASVSAAGDINGDGLADILVGAPGVGAGKSYVVFGSRNIPAWGSGRLNISSSMDGQRGFVLEGAAEDDQSGASVSAAGDINGDGLADILVGVPPRNFFSRKTGKVYVLFGSSNSSAWGSGRLNISRIADGQRGFVLQGEEPGERSGDSVSAAGDINGDGLSDMLMGAFRAGTSGKSYVVFGSRNIKTWGSGVLNISSLMDGQRGFVLQGEEAGDNFGISVSAAGDINGDGLADILVGAPGIEAGKSYVVFGARNRTVWEAGELNISSLMDGQRGFMLQGEGGKFGNSVGTAGDINGDGLSDILVGALYALSIRGKSYIVLGSRNSTAWGSGRLKISSLMDEQRGFVLQGEAESYESGSSVSTAGDINGDGLSDTLIGAPSSSFLSKTGKSYIIFGVSFPFYFTANFLPPISVGKTVQLNATCLAVASTRLDIDVNTLFLTIENLTGGYFAAKSAPTTQLPHFHMQDISDGSIQFVHTGGPLAPKYTVVIDAVPGISPYPTYFDARIDFLGYPPNLINNQLTVNQGLPILVKNSDLSASDQDDTASNLFFMISNLAYGQFTLYNFTTNTTANTTKFSYQNVLDRNVQFISDGSRNVPSYVVIVTDGKSNTIAQAAAVTFNYAPQMNVTISAIILDQRQATTLSPEDISATDIETFTESLIIEVANVSHGYFAYASNSNRSINAFQQLSLTTDTIQFVQDGSNLTPGFALRAFDGILYSPWQPPLLQLNHRPVLVGKMEDQAVIEDEDFNFPLPPNLFRDPDTNDTLTYRAQLQGGLSLPPEIRFTPPGNFAGKLPLTPLPFTIEIQARDNRDVMTSTNFTLRSQESNWTRYKGYYTSGSGVAGVGLTVLTYLWLRSRVTNHRRDFAFANTLRKALNLEYHDFMRFDGDTYKTKISEFMMQLQSEHQRFYTQLTPAEQKSFAVCVGEILVRRNLISPSSCAGGVYGLLFLLSVGWSLQLDMKKFEVQSLDIAAEAVAAWKECEKPLERWPYDSPKMKDKTKAFCCAKPSRAGMFAPSLKLTRNAPAPTLRTLRNRKVHPSPLVQNLLLERKGSINESPFLAIPVEPSDSQKKEKRGRCSMM